MIWITGCKGMLGSELSGLLAKNKIDYIGTGEDVDITDYSVLERFASSHDTAGNRIQFIINCAAYTAVDKAEDEPDKAELINSTGPMNLARLARSLGASLIHISTDYVFDGTASSPINEDMPKSPIGVYGRTKSDGEDRIMAEMTKYYILRTSWLYGFYGKNFVYTMTKAMSARESVKVVADQRGTPTNCSTLSHVILSIITSKEFVPFGIYNVSDEGETTWFDFCREIYSLGTKYKRISNACAVNSCTTDEYPTKARRPAYSVLDKTKIQKALKARLPDWKKSLKAFIKDQRFEPR